MHPTDDHTPWIRRARTTDVVPLGSDRYQLEARLTDMSHHGAYGAETDADQSVIHDIALTAVVGGPDLRIESIEVRPVHLPFDTCPLVLSLLGNLVGESIGSGWRRTVLEVAGGVRGCTHVNTVLLGLGEMIPLVYFLTLNAEVEHSAAARADGRWMRVALDLTPQLANACASLRQDGPVLNQARRAPR